jgi:ribosome-binding ATPase
VGFSCGIVGLPNVGKSTLFNVLTNNAVAAENFPFCTIDPNIANVSVPDERLNILSRISKSEKTVPTTLEFVDIAGLVKGASKGEGLGNKFLSHVRSVDTICHIVRCFESEQVVHVDGEINPKSDYETIMTELAVSDMDSLQRKKEKLQKMVKSGDKKIKCDLECTEAALISVSEHQQLPLDQNDDMVENLKGLLLAKPLMVVCNGSLESDENRIKLLTDELSAKKIPYLIMDIGLEIEAKALEKQERQDFFKEMGYDQEALDRFIMKGYELLGLITFFTSGPKETRAWTIEKGMTAKEAAGKIHTDMERGFICAETYSLEDLKTHGSEKALKEKGKIRQEGRDYVVNDGDVMYFRFNV